MESVKHLGMIKRALRYFQQTRRNTITQAELIGYMTRTTGCSDESVQGTIIGGGTKNYLITPSLNVIGWFVQHMY